jgi:hypothetical protein
MKEAQEADAKVPPAEESKAAKWTRIILSSLGFAIIAVIIIMALVKK